MSAGVEISMVAAEGMTIGLAVLALVVIDKSVKNAPNNKLFPFISIIGFGLYAANLGKISYIMQFPSLFSISLSKLVIAFPTSEFLNSTTSSLTKLSTS